MNDSKLTLLRRRLALAALAALVLGGIAAVAVSGLTRGRSIDAMTAAVPVPIPVYEIEAVSNGRTVRLANLPLGYVGVPQVPVLVDIDGNLVPDVEVSVNLINAEGIFNNPPQPGQVIAPAVEINRLPTGPLLFQGTPPLRINVKLTVIDASGQQAPTVVRFGYDTGLGGSIPPEFKAVVGGLQNFFNPIDVRLDTTGGFLIGLDPGVPDLGLAPASRAYEGPLTLIAGVDAGSALNAAVEARMSPMPNLIGLTYGSDASGHHISLAQRHPGEVDVDLDGSLEADTRIEVAEDEFRDVHRTVTIDGRIDRLPRRIALDLSGDDKTGAVVYKADPADGRRPDARIDMHTEQIGIGADADDESLEQILDADVELEAIPNELSGTWSLPTGEEEGLVSLDFDSSGQGIGAIEARLSNYEGAPESFVPFRPTKRQYASIQAGPGGLLENETLMLARLERIRHATVQETETGGITGSVGVGDGELPLELHAELDFRKPAVGTTPASGIAIAATSVVSPLPDEISFALHPPEYEKVIDDEGEEHSVEVEPLRAAYTASEAVDVTLDASVALPGTPADYSCGDADTFCADVDIHHIPASIEARVSQLDGETRIEIDDLPRENGAPVDVFVDAVVGPISALEVPDFGLLAAPVHAHLDLQGVPAHIRLRTVDGAAQTFERVEFHACDRDFDAGVCRLDADGNPTDGEVAEVAFRVNNFVDRPAGLPAPSATEPVHVTVVGRGVPDTNKLVNFEATGRLTDIAELQYMNVGQLFGVRTDVAGQQNFRTLVDIKDFDLDGGNALTGRVDFDADVKVTPLPTPADFCFVTAGRVLTGTPYDPVTAPCENQNPFGDGPTTSSPLAFAYRAPGEFDASIDVSLEARGGALPFEQPDLPIGFEPFGRVNASLDLTNIPGNFTGFVQTPATGATTNPDGTVSNSMRLLTIAPGANNLTMDLSAELASAGDDCATADLDGSLVCADVSVVGLPQYASALLDTVTLPGGGPDDVAALKGIDFEFHACNRDFTTTNLCRTGTLGEIGSVDVDARVHAGDPSGVPGFLPPANSPHLVALADVESLDDLEVVASARVEKITALSFRQGPDGIDASTRLGDGVKPLKVYADADLSEMTELVPEALRAHMIGEIDVTPLPLTFDYHQVGPGNNQSSPVTVTIDLAKRVNLVADAQIYERDAGPNCGDHGTTCARLAIDNIPEHIVATIGKRLGPLTGNTRDSDTAVDLELTPTTNPAVKPNVTVSAAVGLPANLPVVAESPLFADFKLTGAPRYVSVKLEGVETVRSTPGGLEVTGSSVERFQFHTCKRVYATESCGPGTEGKIDLVDLSARTFDLRPTNFPAPPFVPDPPAGTEPLYLGVSGRGRDLEAVVRIPDISEVQFVNRDGVIAARARVGGTPAAATKPLNVRVDIQDLALPGTLPLIGMTVAEPVLDVVAAIDVTPFPGDASVCIRQPGRVLSGDSGAAFAATCDDDAPFGPLPADAIGHSPLSLGFSATDAFTVSADVDATINGIDFTTTDPIEPQRIIGTLDLADIPTSLTAHVYEPAPVATATGVRMTGPMRARVRMPGAVSGPDLTNFAVSYLVGDRAVCEDPRPTVSALCVSGNIVDLPTQLDLTYNSDLDLARGDVDPSDEAQTTNLVVATSGPGATDVNNLRFSSVKPKRNDDGTLVAPPTADVLIASAELDPFPNPFAVHGTLDLPDGPDDPPTAVFEVQNGQTLPKIVAHVQNFVAPDPTAGIDVPNRPVGDPLNLLGTDTVSVIQRGDALRLDATVTGVQGAGITALFTDNPDANPGPDDPAYVPIGTTALNVRFGQDKNVRAYLDLQPDAQEHTLADLLVENLPAVIDVCVRGPRTPELVDAVPVAGTETWCDSSDVSSSEGAIELFGHPAVSGRKIDIDGFIRLLTGGGAQVIAARVDVFQLPQVLRVTLPADPTADPGGIEPGAGEGVRLVAMSEDEDGELELTPDGIGSIEFQAASFDLATADTGYVPTAQLPLPYTPKAQATGPFPAKPAPADGLEFIHAAAHIPNGDFHVRGRIGRIDGEASSQLQQAEYGLYACPAPPNDPDDYPRYPNDGSEYTCVRAQFADGTDGDNPLSLHAEVYVGDGNTLRLRDAGISNIPNWMQFTLAKSQPFLDPAHQRGWRRPCLADDDEPAQAACMPPLLRFDQPDDSFVFGVAEYGRPTDFATTPENIKEFDDIVALDDAPNFNAVPNKDGWDGPFDRGVRAKIVDYDGGTPTEFDDDRIAARAGFRIAIPQSLTVDQIQSFDSEDASTRTTAGDFRFRAMIRNEDGVPVENLGEVAVLLHLADSNAQVLVGKPCPTNIANRSATSPPIDCAEHVRGAPIPGEIGITLYVREKKLLLPDNVTTRTSTFAQIDGRVSTEMDLGLRILGNGVELSPGITLGYADVALRGVPAVTAAIQNQPHLPGFRVRAEIISDKSSAPPPLGFAPRNVEVGINSASADIDLSPTAVPARLIDAVIYSDGGVKLGADIQGWSQTNPTSPSRVAAPVSFKFAAGIDPLNLHLRTPELVNFGDLGLSASQWLDNLIDAPDWLEAVLDFIGDAIGWFIGAIVDVFEAIINSIALEVEMRASAVLQFSVDRLSHFTLRVNLLHMRADTHGATTGSATVGPIGLDMDLFQAGVPFDLNVDVPGWIDWFPGVPDRIIINELLLGLEYDPDASIFNPIAGPPIDLRASTVLGENLLLDYRSCSNIITQLLPFSGNIETLSLNSITLPGPFGGDLDFILWPLTDPRMKVGGFLMPFAGGVILDALLDVFGGVVLCNVGMDVGDGVFGEVDINTATANQDSYNPGNSGTTTFAGHPVPGQPGHPEELDPELDDPSLPGAPVPAPEPTPISPGPAAPPTPPGAPAPLYSGPTAIVSGAIELCGVHEFTGLTVNAPITVSDTANDDDTPWGTPDKCLPGSEGRLELRANTLIVNGSGSVIADGISTAVPSDIGNAADYAASGSSGGTNAGVGSVGSAPNSGARPYESGTVDTVVYPGSPGSAVPAGYTDPDVTGPIASAGGFGNGGGAIVLKADGTLTVAGTISAIGDPGAGNDTGACDSDEFDDPSNDYYEDDDGDPDTPDVLVEVPDDPPEPGTAYEHTGFIGAGGGAGGGIALQARGTVTLLGTASFDARGGNGGNGVLGAGAGGGGGVIKVLAPAQVGVDVTALETKVAAGVSGTIDPNGTGSCPGIDAPSDPIDDDGQDEAGDPSDDDGTVQRTNGLVVDDGRPRASLLPYGPFWRAGAGSAVIDGYLSAAGAPGTTNLVVCAARLAASAGPADASILATMIGDVTQPTVAAPCGAPGVGSPATVQQISDDDTFTGALQPPAAGAQIEIDPTTSGYYGLYTTAVRADTAGNDCFDPTDLGSLDDTVDCAVEPYTGIEWVIGVDASVPTLSVSAPTNGLGVIDPVVTLDFTAADQALLSGIQLVECQIEGDEDGDGDPIWRLCADGDTFELQNGAGANLVTIRVHDGAGNVTTVTRTVYLASAAPVATATLSFLASNSTGGWYRTVLPSIALASTDPLVAQPEDIDPSLPAISPDRPLFAYRFDNGIEQTCTTNPCTVPASALAALADGEHTFHYTAINVAGARKFDDEDLSTESPMQSLTFKMDRAAPIVTTTIVPPADRLVDGNLWAPIQPLVAVSAVERFGGSGVVLRQYKIGSGSWTTYSDLTPPTVPDTTSLGVEVCAKAFDLAGNESDPFCQTVRVDSTAPALTFTASAPPDALTGWYRFATPTFTADGYTDGGGVGAIEDHFRVRYDNIGFSDCDPACAITPTLATGRHLVHASATDRLGNRSDEITLSVLVDGQAPKTGAIIAPASPEGANGWWHSEPWVTLAARDPGRPWGSLRGSGVATIWYSLDGLTGLTNDPQLYSDSFPVPEGGHELCFFAVDVAGNPEAAAPNCRHLDVDATDPVTTQTPDRAPDSGQWYTAAMSVTIQSTDASPGSGLAPSATEVSVDGQPFVPVTGPLTIGEGVHFVRAFSVDVSGRASEMTEATYGVDLSPPAITIRTLPRDPNAANWYRRTARVVLSTSDGTDNSGVVAVEYRIDNGTWHPYTGPVAVGEGPHTVDGRVTDAVGRQTTVMRSVRVDVTPSEIRATYPAPSLWIRTILGPKNARLNWELTENLSGPVRLGVVIYDATGNVVRRLDGGLQNVTPGVKLSGFTQWDGKNSTITGLVPIGIYYYRVSAIDAAGNVSFSNESRPIQITLGL